MANWADLEEEFQEKYSVSWTPYDMTEVDLKFDDMESEMEQVVNCIWEESEDKYTLEMENLIHMLDNEFMVIDEETGEEVFVDPFTFKYHPVVTTLYTTYTSYEENFPQLS
jgi:hypothetical protein